MGTKLLEDILKLTVNTILAFVIVTRWKLSVDEDRWYRLVIILFLFSSYHSTFNRNNKASFSLNDLSFYKDKKNLGN